MRSLQHVLWRGAMALSLLVLGIGSGVGLAEAPARAADAQVPACGGDHLPLARRSGPSADGALALRAGTRSRTGVRGRLPPVKRRS